MTPRFSLEQPGFVPSDHSFLRALVVDPSRLASVVLEAQNLGLIEHVLIPLDPVRDLRPFERRDLLKRILDGLTSSPSILVASDLRELHEIVARAQNIRRQLTDSRLWNDVFAHLGLALRCKDASEFPRQGQSNLLIRLCCDSRQLVARYLDPVGRNYIPRYEPQKSAAVYSFVNSLVAGCLGVDCTATILVPSPDTIDRDKVDDEAGTSTAGLVASRVVLMHDCSETHVPLVDAMASRGCERFTGPYARLLARLHGSTLGILNRGANGNWPKSVGESIRSSASHLSFSDTRDYSDWLIEQNWMIQTVRKLSQRGKPASETSELEATARSIFADSRRLSRLVRGSAEAMGTVGALVHLDYSPANCLQRKHSPDSLLLIDFERFAVADPAYDFGLGICSYLLYANETGAPAGQLPQLADKMCEAYYDELLAIVSAEQQSIVGQLIARARAFSALAFAAHVSLMTSAVGGAQVASSLVQTAVESVTAAFSKPKFKG